MSDTRLPGTNPTDVVPSATPASTRWTGWIAFAAFLMLMLGFFQAVKGLAAIINPDYFRDTGTRPVFDVGPGTYGWIHLILGALIFLAGLGVLSGNALARAVGVILAAGSIVLTLFDISLAPVWGTVIIVVDLLVIYALIIHGREMAG